MSRTIGRLGIDKQNATGSAAIAFAATVPTGLFYRLLSVSCNFDTAPTTAENYTITLDANAGSDYDLLLYTLDPGTTSTSDILWQPDEEIILEGGDAIDVAYTNTDVRVYGVQVTFKQV